VPMPLAPPVTMATRPSSLLMMSSPFFVIEYRA
jgi:hypothetical protein